MVYSTQPPSSRLSIVPGADTIAANSLVTSPVARSPETTATVPYTDALPGALNLVTPLKLTMMTSNAFSDATNVQTTASGLGELDRSASATSCR